MAVAPKRKVEPALIALPAYERGISTRGPPNEPAVCDAGGTTRRTTRLICIGRRGASWPKPTGASSTSRSTGSRWRAENGRRSLPICPRRSPSTVEIAPAAARSGPAGAKRRSCRASRSAFGTAAAARRGGPELAARRGRGRGSNAAWRVQGIAPGPTASREVSRRRLAFELKRPSKG